MYNHTPNGSKTLRLSGRAANEIVGLGKVLKVVPGDSIHMEVYATYYSPETTSSLIGGSFLGALTGLFGPGAGLGIDGSGFTQSLNEMLGSGQLLKTGDDNDDTPRAYINYILFDENFILQDFDFKRVTEAGHKTGTAAAHDKLELATIVSKSGYLYIYLSNENDKIVDVYFDDLKITHHHSPIIQAADYYPFGGTFNSYTSGLKNQYLNQGKEMQEELETYDFHARMYDPWLVRTWQMDPKSNLYYDFSPYSWLKGNPLKFIDPTGMVVDDYYNRNGEFLYRDDKETDNIMIVSERGEAFASLVKDNGTDDYQNVLEANSVGINEAGLSDEAASNVYTDILSKMPEIDMSKVHNGKVSVYNGYSRNGVPKGYNDPEFVQGVANTAVKGVTSYHGDAAPGTIKVSVNFFGKNNSLLGTVSNVQNLLGVHEYLGHGVKRFEIGGGKHSQAYDLQMSHPSWKSTTPKFKSDMLDNRKFYLQRGN